MLQFDSSKGFTVSEVEDVRSEIASQWKEAFKEDNTPELNTEPETPAGQLIDSQTAAITQKDAEIAFLANQFNPLTSSGKFQDALGKIYFLTRHSAVKSTCTCTCTGIKGTEIEKGALIQSEVTSIKWKLINNAVIKSNGKVDAQFECIEEGPVEAGVNTLTNIVTVVPGWDSVTNANSASVGSYEESQSAFETRRYNSVALNSRGTNGAIYSRISQCDGVLACYIDSNRTNVIKKVDGYGIKPHSVFIAVIGGNNKDIAKAIYDTVSAGCDYNGNTSVRVTDEYTGATEEVTFLRPESLQIYVKVLLKDKETLPNQYETLIKDAIYNNFYGLDDNLIANEPLLRVVMNTDVYASRFTVSILNSNINNIMNISISSDNKNFENMIHIPCNREPVLSKNNIILEFVDEEG